MNKENIQNVIAISNKSISDALQEQYEKGINAEKDHNYILACKCYDRCIWLDKQANSIIADGSYKSDYMDSKIRVEILAGIVMMQDGFSLPGGKT